MLGLGRFNRAHRLMLGIIVLLIVDVVWVVSAELTKFLFENKDFNKPFFTTYVKTVMFSMYLVGFIVYKPWRDQCCNKKDLAEDDLNGPHDPEPESMIGSPIFVPLKYDSYDSHTSGESDDAGTGGSSKSVRFSNLSEVRQLSDEFADDHNLARLSYQASVEIENKRIILQNRLPIKRVAKLAFLFCFLWFIANCTYQEALNGTEAAVVNVLSSTSGLFTLICAAIFPSGPADKFTLSKLVAVLLSLGGIVMVCFSDVSIEAKEVPFGAIWALVSAMFYAFYITLVRHNVENEDKMDIPMFFGFVGISCALVLWPGFFILHYSEQEPFEWPDKTQWLLILANGAIGTVVSEFLWLLGCFLSSSLIATLALSLVTPLSMLADAVIKHKSFGLLFYLGSIPIVLTFFAITFLTHWENWDPVWISLKKFLHFICKRRSLSSRVRELDREQTTSLITEESHH